MKLHYLIGSLVGLSITAKATSDLSSAYKFRSYKYLKCLVKKVKEGTPIKDAVGECKIEAWNEVPLPKSIYAIGLVALIPATVLLYELSQTINTIEKGGK